MDHSVLRSAALLAALSLSAPRAAHAADSGPGVLEPAQASAAEARKPERARWSWNQAPAEVSPGGDLALKQLPFKFEPGKTIRYIDFDKGSDDNDGSKDKPWKHHPWDVVAAGKAKEAKGSITYVFKRGVVYRGELHPSESGVEGDPIRLTSDPSWGSGEAVISGAETVTKWTKGADQADIPEADKVWYADLDFAPRTVWTQQGDKIERVELARTPNWTVSDPDEVRSEWWSFDQPWKGWGGKDNAPGGKAKIGYDPAHLTQPESYYKGAVAHVEYGICMSTPYPTTVESYDPNLKAITFQGIWFGASQNILSNCHYFLEDKPQYLDAPGEFWFAKKGNAGRLYLRLAGDRDPNAADIEAGKRMSLIDCRGGISHLVVSGLTFRYSNVAWELTKPPWGDIEIDNAAIRVIGGAIDDVTVRNCRFDHLAKAVRLDATTGVVNNAEVRNHPSPIGTIVVADNDIDRTDHGAINITCHSVGDVKVLRNHLHEIGQRTYRQDHSFAVVISLPATMEVAGNVVDRCISSGIMLSGGKNGGDDREVPLARYLVHHNKVSEALLGANDWGAIETWQGGPFYNYDNVVANPNGIWHGGDPKSPGSWRTCDYAYYHDGGFQNYDFNDIAYGKSDDWNSKSAGGTAFQEAVPTINNQIFNCTAYRFMNGSNWSPAGGRHFFLGNVFDDIPGHVFNHAQLKEDLDKKKSFEDYPLDTVAYSRNVISRPTDADITAKYGELFDKPEKLQAVFGFAIYGVLRDSLEAMVKSFSDRQPLAYDVGVLTKESPLRDPAKGDFRPKAGSAAIDHGVKVFVPWGLSYTVGEWHFRRNNSDPTKILDDHWCMMSYYMNRETYYTLPVNNLKAEQVTAKDYIAGPLEDWTDGALSFNGKDQFASITQADMGKPVTYEMQVGKTKETRTAEGLRLATPDIGATSLVVEAYLQAKAPGCVLVSKMSDAAGYQLAINKAGGATLTLLSGGAKSEVASGAVVTDGKFHHLLAELDRPAGMLRIYTDGKKTAEAKCSLAADASLANEADFLVGKGAHGNFFTGAIDYLRVARTSLAESKTSIDELYDWELDGPFLRDFAGREPVGKGRDAGALEAEK